MQVHKLGKQAPRLDHRTLQFAKYLKVGLPPAPAEVSWDMEVPAWPMMLNDSLGDCTCAAAGHMIQQWTQYAQDKSFVPTDEQILLAYEVVGGYIPGQPQTDNGAVMLDVLNYWRQTGIGGHKILAYAAINFLDLEEVRAAIDLFGSIYLGIQLPNSAAGQDKWTVPDGGFQGDGSPGSWGGHCIPIMAQSPITLSCITWGERLKMSHNFFMGYSDEAYVVLSQDWIDKNGISPSRFDLAQLQADLGTVTK